MLVVSLINNFQPTVGQTFDLFDGGSLTGSFCSVQVPTVEGYTWNTSQLASGMLSIAANLPGDYNQNGAVDAADYTVWRNKPGSATSLPNDDTAGVSADDYTRWKSNFGQAAGSGGVTAAVPEPTTSGFSAIAVLLCAIQRTRNIRGSAKLA